MTLSGPRPPATPPLLGALERRVLEALWAHGEEASVRTLQSTFPGAAYTTLMTTLDRLYRKGLLERRLDGRAYLYRPRYSRADLTSTAALNTFRTALGSGDDAAPLLSSLVDVMVGHDERLLDELARLVRERRRQHDRRREPKRGTS